MTFDLVVVHVGRKPKYLKTLLDTKSEGKDGWRHGLAEGERDRKIEKGKRRKIVFNSTSVAFVTLTTRTVQKYLFIVYGYFSLPIS